MRKLLLLLALVAMFPTQGSSDTGIKNLTTTGLLSITGGPIYIALGGVTQGYFATDGSNGNAANELILEATGSDNVFALKNLIDIQGRIAGMTMRGPDNREAGAIGRGARGTGGIAFPFTDAVFIETSKIFGFTGPTIAPDFKIVQTHRDGGNAIVWQERVRFTDQGNMTFFQNGAWGAQADFLVLDSANSEIRGTASTFLLQANSVLDPIVVRQANTSGFSTVAFQDNGNTNKYVLGYGLSGVGSPYTSSAYHVSVGSGGVSTPIKWVQYDGSTALVSFQLDSSRKLTLGVSGTALTRIKHGSTTLVAGTKVVSETSVTASSLIFVSIQSLGTVAAPKAIGVTARVNSTSFTITSADNTDTSVIAWELIEP